MSGPRDGSSQSSYPLLKKWTAEEHERLKQLAAAGIRPGEIAKLLKRTEAAVRIRAWQHGIALRITTKKRGKPPG
ncbi:copper homeostasis protein CutC [Bradyrhizobium sp. USDA 4472]